MNQQVLQVKKDAVNEIVEGLKSSESVTVVSYHGLTVAELQELRRTLAKEGASLGVYKNTLVKRALKEENQPSLDEILDGPNALVFSKELGNGPKVLIKFARFHEKLQIKGGVADGQALNADKVKEISKLPNKNGLLSVFLSVLNAPVSRFAATVKAVADKQAPAGAETPAAN